MDAGAEKNVENVWKEFSSSAPDGYCATWKRRQQTSMLWYNDVDDDEKKEIFYSYTPYEVGTRRQ